MTDPTPAAYALRAVRPDEMALVRDSWARSYGDPPTRPRPVQRPPRGLAKWLWYRAIRRGIITPVMDEDGASVIVAVLPDVPDEVLGWLCYAPPGAHPLQLHYAYVKPDYRRRGVARQLMGAALACADERGPVVSHHTRDGDALVGAVVG